MDSFEMGGYLPLELRSGDGRFADIPEDEKFEVNTGRTALWCAINSLHVKKVLVPYYYCPDIISMLETMDVTLDFYRIDQEFMPIVTSYTEDTAIILVNYFGIMGDKLVAFSNLFSKVIFDNAHAFYQMPILKDGVMNIYSCRKFFGVSDGAYVIGKGLQKPFLRQDISSSRALHLLISTELGTNAAYAHNKQNEVEIGKEKLSMSLLTKKIMASADYDFVARKRTDNFHYLHSRLKNLQKLRIDCIDPVPYAYPLLLDKDIHSELVKHHIYVPVLWKQLLDKTWNGTIEQYYSKCIVALPLDQRYENTDMENMILRIEQIHIT